MGVRTGAPERRTDAGPHDGDRGVQDSVAGPAAGLADVRVRGPRPTVQLPNGAARREDKIPSTDA